MGEEKKLRIRKSGAELLVFTQVTAEASIEVRVALVSAATIRKSRTVGTDGSRAIGCNAGQRWAATMRKSRPLRALD